MERPTDIIENLYDGTFYRNVPQADGSTRQHIVCEDCWQNIPPYFDFPRGLVSPESSGDKGGNFAKTRRTMLATEGGARPAVEALQKVVCLPCYEAAFMRTYPDSHLPMLSMLTRGS